jgi:hypothetical protein
MTTFTTPTPGNIILQWDLFPLVFLSKILYTFLIFHVYCFPHIFYRPWLPYMVNSINFGGRHYEIFSSQTFPLPKRPKYSHQMPFFRHLHFPFFLQSERPVHAHIVQQTSEIRFYEWDGKTNWMVAELPTSSLLIIYSWIQFLFGTNKTTPCSRMLLGNPVGLQKFKKFPSHCI